MSQANSKVQVSITASLASGFSQAFASADKRIKDLTKTSHDLNTKIGNIDAFRKQQEAVKQSGYQWQAAKVKLDQYKQTMVGIENPTRKQTADLAKLEKQVQRAGASFSAERVKMAEMGMQLQKNGVHVGKLSSEYQRLQNELAKTKSKQDTMEASLKRQAAIVSGISRSWQTISGLVAGTVAAGMVLKQPLDKAMSYEEKIARLSDTAGAGKSVAEKERLFNKAMAGVSAARQSGGGTNEDAATALETLIATGNMPMDEALAALPYATKAAYASKTDAKDIATLILRLRDMGVSPAQGLDMAFRGGQQGGVELKDMAKYLPEQIASGRASGYSGAEGLAQIVAMNEIGLRTAGDPGQAANNVTNLLNKLASPELKKNVEKVMGKGFDWDAYKMRKRGQGVYAAEAFIELADNKMMADPKYRALKAKLQKAGNPTDRKAAMMDMASMMEGSEMGQFIQDRQALAQALAIRYARQDKQGGKDAYQNMVEGTRSGPGGVENTSEFIRGRTFAKALETSGQIDDARNRTYDAVSSSLGGMLDKINETASKFPGFSAAVYAATVALGALSALSIFKNLALPAGAGAAAGAATGASGGSAVTGGAAAASMLPTFAQSLRAGAPMMAFSAIANMTTSEEDEQLRTGKARMDALREKHGQPMIDEARRRFQPWYQIGSGYASENEIWINKLIEERKKNGTISSGKIKPGEAANPDRPNVTQNNNYHVTITAPPTAGALELADQLNKLLREKDKQAAADARSSFTTGPGF